MLGAVCADQGTKVLTACGVPVTDVELGEDTLSEVLRLYMKESGSGGTLPEVRAHWCLYWCVCVCAFQL